MLADDGTGTLIVDVEVTSSVAELVRGSLEGSAVGTEDGTGQAVFCRLVDEVAGLLEVGVLVDVDGDDGAEDLLDHGDGLGVRSDDDSRLDEVSLGRVRSAADKDLTAFLLGLLNKTSDLVEGDLVDDGTGEVVPLGAWADGDLASLGSESVLEATLPERAGDVSTAKSRALLARVLETGTDSLDDAGLNVGGGVVEVEVLATGLTDKTGVALVLVEVVAGLGPERLEDLSGAGEVERGKVLVVHALANDLRGVTWDELNH